MTMRITGALFVLLVAAPAVAAELPEEVQRAVVGAVTVAGARVVPLSYRPSLPRGCAVTKASVARPLETSGRVAVKLTGQGCTGWAWVRVELWAPVPVTTRAVREGERLAGAFATVEKEIGRGRSPVEVPEGAIAARGLNAGQIIEASHLRAAQAPAAGETVKVVVHTGTLMVETTGRSVACGRGRACAVLPSGRHVEGRMVDGQLLVEVP